VARGIVSIKRPQMETEDPLLREIEEAGRYLDVEQLALSPQCGFGTVAGLQWRRQGHAVAQARARGCGGRPRLDTGAGRRPAWG
jgi:methionine synthase II (cobalamin-independent)